jgi:outer membrane protein assembly factor BamB
LKDRPADLRGIFQAFAGSPADIPGEWPRFRGSDSTNTVVTAAALANSWGQTGPALLWSVEVGEGFAGPAVFSGRVFLLDYDEKNRGDTLRCFSLADGTELWRRSYKVMIKRNHGMSRTVPAVTDRYLVTLGPRCHVVCVDTDTGDFRWGIDLKREYGTEEPLWYASQCPLIEDGQVILAPCGPDVLLMGVNCETGAVMWKTPNPHGWQMSHSSIIPMTLLGRKMYVYCALGGIVGVSASGTDMGAVLWQRAWNAKVVAPSPVQAGNDRVFMTVGYGKGAMMLQLNEENGVFTVKVLFETTPSEGLACEQQTPIYHDGLLYGVMPKDAGALKGQFVCYRPDGTLAWSSGQDHRFGLGPFVLADNKFYILDDDCTLTMLDARAPSYVELAGSRIFEGHDAWGPLAVVGTRMLLRDMNRLACIDIGTAQKAGA